MNRAQLAAEISKRTGLSKKEALEAINGAVGAISEALEKGDSVTLMGFGTFWVGERPAREGRNPRTGAKLSIQATRSAKFKAGSALRSRVKGSGA